MVVLPHNIRLDPINQHITSLYIGEQCATLKTYVSLTMGV